MVELIVLVGIPASGKTTYAKSLENENTIRLSSDDIREELFGDVGHQGDSTVVFQEMDKRTKVALKSGKSVIYDATNANSRRRIHLIKSVPKDVVKKCVYFTHPIGKLCERDFWRDKTVGKEVIMKVYKRLSPPMYWEGWSDIKIVSNYKELSHFGKPPIDLDILKNVDSYEDYVDYLSHTKFRNVIEYNQNNLHHTLTLSRHMYKTFTNLQNHVLYGHFRPKLILSLACLLHDIGKPDCQDYNGSFYSTFYRHENTSAQGAMWLLHMSGYNDDIVIEVGTLIQLHMHLMQKDMNLTKFKNKIGENRYKSLQILNMCDTTAK